MYKPPSASERKPKALFLAPESPYPAIGGGPLRSASLIEYLASRFSVHAIVFRQPGDRDPAQAIPSGRIDKLDALNLPYHSRHPLPRALRNSRRLIRKAPPLIDRFAGFEKSIASLVASQRYEFAVIEHFWCAPYIDQLRSHCRKAVLDLHNIESRWYQSLAVSESYARAWTLRRFAAASAQLERQWLSAFDSLLVTSPLDAQFVCGLVPSAHVAIYPNALPETPLPPRQERQAIAFSGNLEYQPNISAIRFFARQIWPSLRRSWPKLVWKIIGKNAEAIREIVGNDPRIQVTGFVQDAIAELASASVAVVPLLAGSGTRIKIIEAWAAATPVVSTTTGAEGLAAHHEQHLLLADTPDAFIEAVSRLLGSAADRSRIGAGGRQLYQQRYTWPIAWKALDSVFGNIAETSVV